MFDVKERSETALPRRIGKTRHKLNEDITDIRYSDTAHVRKRWEAKFGEDY
jgi:hypothetical protein